MKQEKAYEIRCPLYGFVKITEWERDIIALPEFQRLRRIRQLAWTDQVYPGAMHTRFEHSLGVMELATRMYDAVVESSKERLSDEFGYNADGFRQQRIRVRLAALLHDVGHAPFSHAGEELMPFQPESESKRYKHEHYSSAIIRHRFKSVIDDHQQNNNYRVGAEEIAALIDGTSKAGESIFWREIVSGQIDADRTDYLRRDSLHCGVTYGHFDWRRLLNTVVVVPDPETEAARLGVEEGGVHAAEAMILARYFMFTQVYFHKTRMAFNVHLQDALKELLGGEFPKPTEDEIGAYLRWDDWRVLGLLAEGEGGEHGRRLAGRDHFREVFHTPEQPSVQDEERLEKIKEALGELLVAEDTAGSSWYKRGSSDIPILDDSGQVRPLSHHSPIVEKIENNRQVRLYSTKEDLVKAKRIVSRVRDVTEKREES